MNKDIDQGIEFKANCDYRVNREYWAYKRGAHELYTRGKADAWKEAVQFLCSDHPTPEGEALFNEGKKRGYL